MEMFNLDLTHETGHPKHETTSAACCFHQHVDTNYGGVVGVVLLS
jgi:hypothetical protein